MRAAPFRQLASRGYGANEKFELALRGVFRVQRRSEGTNDAYMGTAAARTKRYCGRPRSSCHVQVLLVVLLFAAAGSIQGQPTPARIDAENLLKLRAYLWNDTYNSLQNWYMSHTNHACEWKGVECSATGNRVTGVVVSGLALSGGLPRELGQLSELKKLDLSQNYFMGSIPAELGLCKNLTELNLGNNFLMGDVPAELGNLKNLRVLLLNNNNLYGTLPSTLANLTNLSRFSVAGNRLFGYPFQLLSGLRKIEYLGLSNNKFEGVILNQTVVNWPYMFFLMASSNYFAGTIPASVGNLTQLEELDISNNRLQGTIPPEIAFCTGLLLFNASFNGLSGPIPELGQAPNLVVLDLRVNAFNSGFPVGTAGYRSLMDLRLSKNKFTELPPDISTLRSMAHLDVSKNLLAGSIPVTIGNLSKIRYLNLSYNRLSGSIPPQIGGCTNLQAVDLSNNILGSIIPYTIIRLSSLQSLNLSRNRLVGNLPEEFAYLTQLTAVDLAGNALVGTIPKQLGNLPNLRLLDLSSNKFSGIIPDNLMKGLFPQSAFIGNPDLCGAIINRSCTLYTGRIVGSGGVMVSAACLVLSVIFVLVVTWWFCCRDDIQEKLTSSVLPPGVLRRFSAGALEKATDSFSALNFLGATSLSSVYRADIDDETVVAVKVLCPEYYAGERRNFAVEAKVLVKVNHPNIVKVLGCCNSFNMVALVMEHMPGGSLENHLYVEDRCELGWIQRLDMAFGVAEALAYMHHEWESILWCDVKSSSILLDKDLKAHISNYRLAGANSNKFSGPAGHLAPEYSLSATRTLAGDVYSYGVLVLELLTRVSPHGDILWHGGLTKWVEQSYPETVAAILDPELMENTVHHQSLIKCTELALSCTRENPLERPAMSDVVHLLHKVKRSRELLEENPNKRLGPATANW